MLESIIEKFKHANKSLNKLKLDINLFTFESKFDALNLKNFLSTEKSKNSIFNVKIIVRFINNFSSINIKVFKFLHEEPTNNKLLFG